MTAEVSARHLIMAGSGFGPIERMVIFGLLGLFIIIQVAFLGIAIAVFADYKKTCTTGYRCVNPDGSGLQLPFCYQWESFRTCSNY